MDKIPKTGGELMAKYPKIFRQKDLTIQQSCMPWGICCGEGWLPLLDKLCHHLQFNTDVNGFPQVEATQVKEKLGTLRFYYMGAEDWKPSKPWHHPRSFWQRLKEAWDYILHNKLIRNDIENDDGYIFGMISTFECWSAHVCEICGERGSLCRRGGWLKTLCPKHAKELEFTSDDYEEEEEEGPTPVPEATENK